MPVSLRKWLELGVTLKVELSTSGSLVAGSVQTQYPFQPGGEFGGPLGWDCQEAYGGFDGPDNEHLYTFTTSSTGIFGVSINAVSTNVSKYAGAIHIATFPMVAGRRYQVGGQARQMAGKGQSNKAIVVQHSTDGSSWTSYASQSGTNSQTDWEDILVTGPPATKPLGRLYVLGGSSLLVQWGTEFRDCYINELDMTPPVLTWHDITCDVHSLAVRYGREKFTNRYDVSTLSLDLLNADGKYSYKANHPLGLAPGRVIKVTATYEGVEYPLAYHVIDKLNDTYSLDGHVVASIDGLDVSSILSKKAAKSTFGIWGVLSGKRIDAVLDQVGYLSRQVDAGQWVMQGITASSRTLRDEAGVTAESEGASFFADRQGQMVYKDRTWASRDIDLQQVTADLMGYKHEGVFPVVDDVPTQPDTPLVCFNDLETDWSLDRLINFVSLARTGGTAKEYVDEESFKQYGPATYQRHDFVLDTDQHLPTRAADLMTGYADPTLRVNKVTFNPGATNAWKWTLEVFLNWMVRVWYGHPTNYWGYATCVRVQSVEHVITPKEWVTTLSVDLPASFVEIDWYPGSGWDNGLWDYAAWDSDPDQLSGAFWDDADPWNDPLTIWGA